MDEVFVCGSDKTTPDVKDINPKNASAWVYFKIFVFFIIAYIPTRIGFIEYGNAKLEIIKLRGFLAPGGHVAWAAIEGAALMYVKGFDKLDKKHLNDKRFLLICLIPVVLHGIWDMPIQAPYYLVQIAMTVLAWLVIIYFINLGLKQIDDAKKLEIEKQNT